MCNGVEYGLEDGLIMPSLSMFSNSSLATRNLVGCRRRGDTWTGGSVVLNCMCSVVLYGFCMSERC